MAWQTTRILSTYRARLARLPTLIVACLLLLLLCQTAHLDQLFPDLNHKRKIAGKMELLCVACPVLSCPVRPTKKAKAKNSRAQAKEDPPPPGLAVYQAHLLELLWKRL